MIVTLEEAKRELAIIRARRLTDDDTVTLEELGNEMGISKERVRQIEARALEKLKAALSAEGYDDVAIPERGASVEL